MVAYTYTERFQLPTAMYLPSWEKLIDQMNAGPPRGTYEISCSLIFFTESYTDTYAKRRRRMLLLRQPFAHIEASRTFMS